MTVLEMQLRVLRAACEAVIYAIDSYMEMMEQARRQRAAEPTPAPVTAPAASEAPVKCPHPPAMRVMAPAMGAANRFHCKQCDKLVNPEEEV